MTAQPEAVFFDLDGTILDWTTGMEESWLASCEAHCDGSYVPTTLHEAIRSRRYWFWEDATRARTGRMDLDAAARQIVRLAFADAGIEPDALADRIADDYRARRMAHLVPYPGAIEAVESLRERGLRTALLTNGSARSQRASVERYRLARLFDCIVIEGEFGVGKPDERVFRRALESCGVRPETSWMVGDSIEADIAPAIGLGMHAVWVDGAGAGLPEGAVAKPHRIVRSISELAALG
jgi:putative hydrolase of the HAD superfamily